MRTKIRKSRNACSYPYFTFPAAPAGNEVAAITIIALKFSIYGLTP